ncbi:MAG: glycosyltransferase [Planctomycetes bacterium]|nr:glycosyltransferase [Planctomycetota bacterium]
MSSVTIILLAGWGAICSVWFGLIVAQNRAKRDGLFLEVASTAGAETIPRETLPNVCVVIAARNEAAGLVDCLRNILQQDYPKLSIRVIDDRSEDDTFAIAQEIARTDPRIRVDRIDQLPPGWMGKSHALWRGTRNVSCDRFLFTDVDCKLAPQAISRAIQEADKRNVELLTLWPQQSAGGFWEHTIIPLCGGIIALWFGSQRVNSPHSSLAFANGQFLLFEREAYERIGGHEAVRSALIEDIPLAEQAKKSNVRCWVASGRDLVSVRMYDNYNAIINGWARIYVGALRSGSKIAISIIWLLFGSLLPYVAGIYLIVRFLAMQEAGETISMDFIGFAVMCVNHLTLMMIASYRFWGMGGCRRLDLLWYPLSVCVVIGILIRSWWWLIVRRSIPWRNTRYVIDRQATIVE